VQKLQRRERFECLGNRRKKSPLSRAKEREFRDLRLEFLGF
jgi:hypothetical protein